MSTLSVTSGDRRTARTPNSSTRCARWACVASGRPCRSRTQSRRGHAACRAPSGRVEEASEPAGTPAAAHRASQLAPSPEAGVRASASDAAKAPAPADSGRGRRARARARAPRAGRFEGGQMPIHMRMRKLPAAHEEVDALRAVPDAHPAVNISASRAASSGTEVTIELMKANGLATARRAGEDAGQGRAEQALTVYAHGSARRAERIERPAAAVRSSTADAAPARANGRVHGRID